MDLFTEKRFRLLCCVLIAAVFGMLGVGASEGGGVSDTPRMTGAEALEELVQGNERFTRGRPKHQHTDTKWRQRLTAGQRPFATILACSDSRVPIELLFDQGFGDLFVIRVAGNVVGEDEIGSIEYGVAHLQTPLVFVLGHESCGAVTAALAPPAVREKELAGIQRLLAHIDPALVDIDPSLPEAERVRQGVEANVRWSMQQLSDLEEIKKAAGKAGVVLAGGVYDLETGHVRIIEKIE